MCILQLQKKSTATDYINVKIGVLNSACSNLSYSVFTLLNVEGSNTEISF